MSHVWQQTAYPDPQCTERRKTSGYLSIARPGWDIRQINFNLLRYNCTFRIFNPLRCSKAEKDIDYMGNSNKNHRVSLSIFFLIYLCFLVGQCSAGCVNIFPWWILRIEMGVYKLLFHRFVFVTCCFKFTSSVQLRWWRQKFQQRNNYYPISGASTAIFICNCQKFDKMRLLRIFPRFRMQNFIYRFVLLSSTFF